MTREWQTLDVEFTAAAGDIMLVHIDLGEVAAAVEVADLSMRLLPDGPIVEPSLAPIPSGG